MNLNTLNKPEPSWRELGRLVREMTWAERREFFRLALMPWPDRRDNIKMLFKCSTVTVANIIVMIALANAVTKNFPSFTAFAIMLSVGATYASSTLQTWGQSLARGVRARNAEVNRKLMEEMQKVVDEFGSRMVERLKEASGREHIDMNPISMAAANIEAVDKSWKPVKPENPLKAALEDRLHPNDLVDDDRDESAF